MGTARAKFLDSLAKSYGASGASVLLRIAGRGQAD